MESPQKGGILRAEAMGECYRQNHPDRTNPRILNFADNKDLHGGELSESLTSVPVIDGTQLDEMKIKPPLPIHSFNNVCLCTLDFKPRFDYKIDFCACPIILFWRWTMPHRVRNVWYRYLHNCLSAKATLHRRVTTLFPSPLCPICSLCPEDFNHLLFLCPVKSVFWSTFMQEFFTIPSDSTTAICPLIMSTLSIPPVSHTGASSLSSHQIFTAALHSVWQAHWRFVFDHHPVTSQALRLSTYQKLTILLQQQATKDSSFTSPSL